MHCPCIDCYKVDDPVNCHRKNCEEWQQWWIERWEAIRKMFGVV